MCWRSISTTTARWILSRRAGSGLLFTGVSRGNRPENKPLGMREALRQLAENGGQRVLADWSLEHPPVYEVWVKVRPWEGL